MQRITVFFVLLFVVLMTAVQSKTEHTPKMADFVPVYFWSQSACTISLTAKVSLG